MTSDENILKNINKAFFDFIEQCKSSNKELCQENLSDFIERLSDCYIDEFLPIYDKIEDTRNSRFGFKKDFF